MSDNSIVRSSDLTGSGTKPKTAVTASPPAKVRVPAPAAVLVSPTAAQRVREGLGNLDSDDAQRRGHSTSVYFSNHDNLSFLIKLGRTKRRASVSSVMSQLLAHFVEAYKKAEAASPGTTVVTLDQVKVHI